MTEANLVYTPIIKRSTILLGKDKDTEFNVIDYQHLVEKLIHLSQITQPYLAFIISRLGQHMVDRCLSYCQVAKRVLQYLKGNITL